MENIFKNHFYINLEKRKDRKDYMIEELKKLDIQNANRFEAIQNDNGLLGCGLSHIKVIEKAKELNWDYVCVFEDDLLILNVELLKSKVSKLINEDFDILLLSGNNFKPFKKFKDYLKVYRCYTTGAYIIKKHYYDTWLENLKEGVELLAQTHKNNQYALDVHSHLIQGRDKWWLIKPICAVQKASYSDINKENVNYEKLMYKYDK